MNVAILHLPSCDDQHEKNELYYQQLKANYYIPIWNYEVMVVEIRWKLCQISTFLAAMFNQILQWRNLLKAHLEEIYRKVRLHCRVNGVSS